MRPVRREGWPEEIEEFARRDWRERALFVLNLPVQDMPAQAFRQQMQTWDHPIRPRDLGARWDQRETVTLVRRIAEGWGWRGGQFEGHDLDLFLRLVGELRLEPLPMVRDAGEQVLYEPTPRNLTFGGRFWPSVGSALLLLYLNLGGFTRDRLCVCFLPACNRVFLSQKGWAQWCSPAHRVAGHRLRRAAERQAAGQKKTPTDEPSEGH